MDKSEMGEAHCELSPQPPDHKPPQLTRRGNRSFAATLAKEEGDLISEINTTSVN